MVRKRETGRDVLGLGTAVSCGLLVMSGCASLNVAGVRVRPSPEAWVATTAHNSNVVRETALLPEPSPAMSLCSAADGVRSGGGFARLGLFLPSGGAIKDIYGGALLSPAFGYGWDINPQSSLLVAFDFTFADGTPYVSGPVLSASADLTMGDLQITGLYKPDPATGFFVGGGLNFVSFTEEMTVVFTDLSVLSGSASGTEVGFHLMAGIERPMSQKGSYQAGLLLRVVSTTNAFGEDTKLGGLTLFGGVRF